MTERTCQTCLFREKSACVWYERSAMREVMLCGGVHWELKPPHMYQAPEDRVFPFQQEEEQPS